MSSTPRASSPPPTRCRWSTSCATTRRARASRRRRCSRTRPTARASSSGSRGSLKTDLLDLTIRELTDAYRRGETTPSAATEAYLGRIAALDGRVGAYLSVTAERARAAAAAADARYRAGAPRGPLDGAPVALKDLLCTRGVPTTCGSRILESFVPPYDATVVARLDAAGAVLLGKTNMDEFAMGSSTEHSAFRPTHNPWDLARVPGGSSGGSAAAVAAALAAGALGTDTGGSIRQPAAFCGVVGLKPTYGRVSRYGLVAFGSSLDQIGPLARDVADAAILLGAIAGHDPLDTTSVLEPVSDYAAGLGGAVAGLRVGVPAEYFTEGMDPSVERAVRAAIELLRGLGIRTETVSLPTTAYALAAYYLIAPAEASSNLARYDGVKYGLRVPGARDLGDMYGRTRAAGFGAEVKRRIMLGTYALSAGYYEAYYGRAQRVRTLVRRDFEAAFTRVDLIVAPTTPNVAFKHGEKEDPLAMYLNDALTIPANLTGLPALSVPCGLSPEGLPIGLQFIGRAFDEATLLRAAAAYEQAAPWRARRPELR
ncbi:MAG: Asp-tRNA(Asn)/Glu-tRNA(Gln) amidotransferase subunit GatA [Candidatus Rokubacteria bacterium]|nr:Asp-tRNA(Asn)/Glu-tRNA(Gln) amidotransferase subunit GatA [Candidatus Rokubacteria bacterium]